MDKSIVQHRLGGTPEKAARWLRIPVEVFIEWPEVLNPMMEDRALAAILKAEVAKATNQNQRQWFADVRNKYLLESMVDRISLAAIMANLMDPVPIEFARPAGDDDDGPKPLRRKRARAANSESPPASTAAA